MMVTGGRWVWDWRPGFHKPCGAITACSCLHASAAGVCRKDFRRGGSLQLGKSEMEQVPQ